jgi:hypothetical protein
VPTSVDTKKNHHHDQRHWCNWSLTNFRFSSDPGPTISRPLYHLTYALGFRIPSSFALQTLIRHLIHLIRQRATERRDTGRHPLQHKPKYDTEQLHRALSPHRLSSPPSRRSINHNSRLLTQTISCEPTALQRLELSTKSTARAIQEQRRRQAIKVVTNAKGTGLIQLPLSSARLLAVPFLSPVVDLTLGSTGHHCTDERDHRGQDRPSEATHQLLLDDAGQTLVIPFYKLERLKTLSVGIDVQVTRRLDGQLFNRTKIQPDARHTIIEPTFNAPCEAVETTRTRYSCAISTY